MCCDDPEESQGSLQWLNRLLVLLLASAPLLFLAAYHWAASVWLRDRVQLTGQELAQYSNAVSVGTGKKP